MEEARLKKEGRKEERIADRPTDRLNCRRSLTAVPSDVMHLSTNWLAGWLGGRAREGMAGSVGHLALKSLPLGRFRKAAVAVGRVTPYS